MGIETINLKDLFNNEQLKQIDNLVKNEEWKTLKEYLAQFKEELFSVGIDNNYLSYYLEYQYS